MAHQLNSKPYTLQAPAVWGYGHRKECSIKNVFSGWNNIQLLKLCLKSQPYVIQTFGFIEALFIPFSVLNLWWFQVPNDEKFSAYPKTSLLALWIIFISNASAQ